MKIAILGGGASGFALAGLLSDQAKDLGLEIEIFEQGPSPLRKVRATGNGRCNFTNRNMGPEFYTGGSSSFVKPIIDKFSYPDALKFFEGLGMPALTLESGMTYPRTLSAETVASLLYSKALHGGVKISTARKGIALHKSEEGFELILECPGKGPISLDQDLVVLSTGGAYGIGKKEWSNGYSLVKDFGHSLTPIHPGIIALKVQETDLCQILSGLKMEAQFTLVAEGKEGKKEKTFSGDLLFTDYGLSGMGIFRLSNQALDALWEKEKVLLKINFFPDLSQEALSQFLNQQFQNHPWTAEEAVRGILPPRAAGPLLKLSSIAPQTPTKKISLKSIEAFSALLQRLVFHPVGVQKKDHGQITCGGISTNLVDPKTLMSKVYPGLFFTGEVLDVQGICGGYNLHWAWASAFTAYEGILSLVKQRKTDAFLTKML